MLFLVLDYINSFDIIIVTMSNIDTEGIGDMNVVIMVTNSVGKDEDGRLLEIIKPKLSETIENKLPSLADESQITNVEDLEVEVIQEVLVDVVNSTVKTETGINGITKLQKPKLSNSSMIKIVGIQDKRPTSQISLSKPLQTKTSYTTFEPDNKQNQNRAPRKQTLGGVAGYNQV